MRGMTVWWGVGSGGPQPPMLPTGVTRGPEGVPLRLRRLLQVARIRSAGSPGGRGGPGSKVGAAVLQAMRQPVDKTIHASSTTFAKTALTPLSLCCLF